MLTPERKTVLTTPAFLHERSGLGAGALRGGGGTVSKAAPSPDPLAPVAQNAILRVEQARIQAEVLKRIAVAGRGKRGATRVLVAKGGTNGIFFIAGRKKSDPGSDFSDSHVAQARLIGEALQKADTDKLDRMTDDGTLEAICHGNQED